MTHVAFPGIGSSILVGQSNSGRAIAFAGVGAVESLAADQTFAPTTAASEEIAGTVTFSIGPLAWWIPFAAPAGSIILRGSGEQVVALSGLAARGVDLTHQTFRPTEAPSQEVAGAAAFSFSATRAWFIPVMGLEPMLLRGQGGGEWAAPGIVMAFEEPSGQTWLPVTALSVEASGNATFTLGRWSFVLQTPGFPTNPIAVMPP